MISQLINSRGNPAMNQFVINSNNKTVFQSYESIICVKDQGKTFLNSEKYQYSKTTSKHLNIFLGIDSKTLKNNVKTGLYSVISESEIEKLAKG